MTKILFTIILSNETNFQSIPLNFKELLSNIFLKLYGIKMTQVRSKDLILLQFLAEYHVLTIQQTASILEITRRAVRKKTDKLHSDKLINVMPINFGQGKGRPENLITISENGIKLLYENNVIDQKILSDRIIFKDYGRVEHELFVNWFRINLEFLQKQIPDINTDFISSTSPLLPLRKNGSPLISDKVTINGEERIFIPDGVFFNCTFKTTENGCYFFLKLIWEQNRLPAQQGNQIPFNKNITNYIVYFSSEGYKRYQKKWECELNGFRVLFVTNSAQHKEVISRFLRESKAYDFVWVTSREQLFQYGLSGNVWTRGGYSTHQQSILGPSLAQELPLPRIQD